MTEAPHGSTRVSLVQLAVTICCATILAAAAVGWLWARDMEAPRVTLLGSGDGELAVLVSAGAARLLIAAGDDPASLTTALERARHPTTRRLDVLLVGGTERDLRGALPLFGDVGTRLIGTIGARPASALAGALPASALVISTPTRYALTADVTVDLEPISDAEGGAPEWRALIRRGESSVLVVSTATAADRLALPDPVAALVIATGRDPLAAWEQVPAPLLAFPDGALAGDALRDAAARGNGPAAAIRVFPAEAIRLGLGATNLAIAEDLVQPLATPVSGGRRPLPAGPRRIRRGPRRAGQDRRADRPR